MKTIKNKLALLLLFAVSCLMVSCDKSHDEWADGDPALQHVYFYSFKDWAGIPFKNPVKYDVERGKTIAIPTEFHSAFKRPYSPEVSYYTATDPKSATELKRGTDYEVVDKDGNVLTPGENDAFPMVWKNAEKGVQNIYIKISDTAAMGTFRVLTFDPAKKMDPTDVSTTTIVKTDEYEVRGISENYYVLVNVK